MKLNQRSYSVGVLGVRGYVGQELVKIIDAHPALHLEWVSSRQLAGQKVLDMFNMQSTARIGTPDLTPETAELMIENLSPEQVASQQTDVIILALPNGLASPFVAAIESQSSDSIQQILLDLSADYRFDDDWHYALPETKPVSLSGAHSTASDHLIKLSNPGCYATAMQLALAPLLELMASPPHCFGISGFSGAGTKPSDKNNPEKLKQNILPYALANHLHQNEVSHHLAHQVWFSPHVAEFFRGITMTVQVELSEVTDEQTVRQVFEHFYQHSNLVAVVHQIPDIQSVVNTPNALVGGISLAPDGKHLTLVACLDNLLKGAASQAVQNINRVLQLPDTCGLVEMEVSSLNHKQTTQQLMEAK